MTATLKTLVLQAGQLLGNGTVDELANMARRVKVPEAWERAIAGYKRYGPARRNPAKYFESILDTSVREIKKLERVSIDEDDEEEDVIWWPVEAITDAQLNNPELVEIWRCALGRIQQLVNGGNFETYFRDTRAARWDGHTFTIVAPTPSIRQALTAQFNGIIRKALGEAIPEVSPPPGVLVCLLRPRGPADRQLQWHMDELFERPEDPPPSPRARGEEERELEGSVR